jgi:hypothetical protein
MDLKSILCYRKTRTKGRDSPLVFYAELETGQAAAAANSDLQLLASSPPARPPELGTHSVLLKP